MNTPQGVLDKQRSHTPGESEPQEHKWRPSGIKRKAFGERQFMITHGDGLKKT